MTTTDNNGQYTLFEYPVNDSVKLSIEQEDLQKMDLGELFKFLAGQGVYVPFPEDKKILEKGNIYYQNNIEQVKNCLTASGLTQEIIDVVTNDYGNALLGNFTFSASVATMATTVRKIKPAAAFLVDRYGFYRLLLLQYYKFAKVTIEYLAKAKNADTDTKTKFLESVPTMNNRAIGWAIRTGYISAGDFADVPTVKFARFADNARRFSELFDYGQYYHLCKAAYLATPEQLKTIRPPKALGEIEARGFKTFAEDFYNDCERGLNIAMERFSAPLDASKTPQEQEKAREKAQEWNPIEQVEKVKISKNLNAIMQRPIEAVEAIGAVEAKGARAKYQTNTLPIRKHIEAFLVKPENAIYNNGLITEDLLQRTVGGLDLMRSVLQFTNVKIGKNWAYIFETNLNEFSEICGMKGAYQREKLALFGCLMILKGVYVHTSFPVKKKKKNGKHYTEYVDDYVQVANIPYFNLINGKIVGSFTIQMTASDLGGELMPITTETYQLLRKQAKGTSERRFQAQLLGKNNKKESALVDECFGYADSLKYSATPEELQKNKERIWRHRAESCRIVKEWFDKYVELGVIKSYTLTKNKAGEMVYTWERERTTEDDPTATKAVDIITDAEIVDDEQDETGNAQG